MSIIINKNEINNNTIIPIPPRYAESFSSTKSIGINIKSIELIKVIKQNIVTLLNTTINFIDEKLYKKLYDLFNMLFQYVIKLSKKSYKEAQKLFNTFLKKAKKDRQ